MKKAPFLLGFALASALSVPAMAMDAAPTAEHWTAGLLLGYGARDGVGFGLGLRGGYTLPMNVYIGGTFVYHFGKSDTVPGVGDVSANAYYLGAEGGYDIAAGPVIVRPYLGLGPVFVHGSATINGISRGDTATKFGLWPGGAVFYPINNFFVGGDIRVLIVPDSDDTAFSIFATGGMQF